ncbi:hypothetical protein [Bradyrhizobium jicamae]|uniref:hypothetical protein n=1 Tax=Bradyrhizobium jicamae TaxID=280332 RepID=UPI001BA8B574|nr:hypothetical protein [Bradyrhizobium jicamae]MBR0939388.1 hypothetical protein [Bradyrhizobium jicamae]
MGIERSFPPEHFRKRAEEMRAKADNCEDKGARAGLLRAAASYDQMAKNSELIHKAIRDKKRLDAAE